MFKNYLKIATRSLLKYKYYTLINIMGLAVGITCCILIMLFVRSEFSYDRFHEKSASLYRLWQHEKVDNQDFINVITSFPAAAALQQSFPEVASTCRIFSFNPIVKVDNKSFTEKINMVDSTFFQLFDFEFNGKRNTPFQTSNSIVLTTETAKKYFGTVNPVGKTVMIQLGDEKIDFIVSGITHVVPENSSIKYNALISFANAKYMFNARMFHNWFNIYCETYVLLKPNADAVKLEKKFPALLRTQLGENYGKEEYTIHLQPLTAIHLGKDLPAGNEPISDIKYSYILSSIGLLILLVACVNFITLSIGRSASRAMEVGVRKVLGAARAQLTRQFWGEAFLLTLLSVFTGLIFSILLLKPFNHLINRELILQPDLTFILYTIGLVFIIALVAGIYPSVILSGYKPVEVLKGKLKLSSHKGWFRQSLVIGQFVVSIAMIICTIVISRQMQFMQSADLGYKKDQMVVVATHKPLKEGFPLASQYQSELLKHSEVTAASISVFSMAQTPWVQLGFSDENKQYKTLQYNSIDPDFLNTMQIKVIEGRNFSTGNTADTYGSAIVNEAFVKSFNIKDPIGKKLPGHYSQQIIGVVKDFNFESLHTTIKPLLLTIKPDSVLKQSSDVSFNDPPQPHISIRLKAGNLAANINILREAWKSVAPTQDFDYHFLDETIASQYQQEERTSSIVKIASGLSIFIACMGLFALAALAITSRIKEIGIRKVLGAGIWSIVQLLATGFLRPVLIAALIASPLAWWAMSVWLKDFAFKIPVEWWVFVLSAVVALAIAFATVSVQSIRAALTKPADSLRSE